MITVCTMDARHVAAVAALEQVCFSDPWSARSVAAELCNPLSLWLVALDAETVVGYVGSQAVMGEADMLNLAVKPEYRRQGIAEALVARLVLALRARQVGSLTLEVRASNAPAQALYRKLGFARVGTRRGYYEKPKEDAFILRKEWEI